MSADDMNTTGEGMTVNVKKRLPNVDIDKTTLDLEMFRISYYVTAKKQILFGQSVTGATKLVRVLKQLTKDYPELELTDLYSPSWQFVRTQWDGKERLI